MLRISVNPAFAHIPQVKWQLCWTGCNLQSANRHHIFLSSQHVPQVRGQIGGMCSNSQSACRHHIFWSLQGCLGAFSRRLGGGGRVSVGVHIPHIRGQMDCTFSNSQSANLHHVLWSWQTRGLAVASVDGVSVVLGDVTMRRGDGVAIFTPLDAQVAGHDSWTCCNVQSANRHHIFLSFLLVSPDKVNLFSFIRI